MACTDMINVIQVCLEELQTIGRGEMLKALIFPNAQALATRRGRSAKLMTKLKLQAYGEQYYEGISFRVSLCKLLVSSGQRTLRVYGSSRPNFEKHTCVLMVAAMVSSPSFLQFLRSKLCQQPCAQMF